MRITAVSVNYLTTWESVRNNEATTPRSDATFCLRLPSPSHVRSILQNPRVQPEIRRFSRQIHGSVEETLVDAGHDVVRYFSCIPCFNAEILLKKSVQVNS